MTAREDARLARQEALLQQLSEAARALRTVKDTRDRAVCKARDAGCTVPEVADAAGLSVNGVYRVLARRRHPSARGAVRAGDLPLLAFISFLVWAVGGYMGVW